MNNLEKNELLDGRYLLLDKKGKGSYGEVWRAKDLRLDLEVAVKLYYSLNSKDNEDLKSEFVMTSRLNHPNLLRASYFGTSVNRSYIVMPYCPSISTKLIGCCSETMLWKFVFDVASGLSYLHSRDIIHHDIKPDNILIGENNSFLISDFGISTQLRSTLRRNRGFDGSEMELAGTIGYMAPEMTEEEPFSVKASDIWSFGASLYELLTGELPFYGNGGAMQNKGAQLSEVPYGFVSHDLVAMMCDCMAKEPWNRPQAYELSGYAKMVLENEKQVPSWEQYFHIEKVDNKAKEEKDRREVSHHPSRHNYFFWIGAAAALIIGTVLTMVAFSPKEDLNEPQSVQPTALMEEPVIEDAPPPFLKVNGEDAPKPLYTGSNECSKTITVSTDGADYTINDMDFPAWIALDGKTDSSFVLHLSPNKSVKQRKDTIKLMSGSLNTKLVIVQKADEEAVKRSKLTPVTNVINIEKSGIQPVFVEE